MQSKCHCRCAICKAIAAQSYICASKGIIHACSVSSCSCSRRHVVTSGQTCQRRCSAVRLLFGEPAIALGRLRPLWAKILVRTVRSAVMVRMRMRNRGERTTGKEGKSAGECEGLEPERDKCERGPATVLTVARVLYARARWQRLIRRAVAVTGVALSKARARASHCAPFEPAPADARQVHPPCALCLALRELPEPAWQ